MKKGVMYTFGASIILIICFIAFVLPSSLSKTAQQQEGLVFGKYKGKKISYEYGSDFTNFLSQYAQMYRNQGIEITSSNQMTVYNYAFNSTVLKYQQEDALKAADYEVPQDTINLTLKNYFKDSDGKFSMKAYKQADPTYIENLTKSIKDSLYTGRYYDDYYGTSETLGGHRLFGLKSSKAEKEFIDSFGKERRAFNLVVFETGNYPEEEQLKFGKANPQKFTKYDMSIITYLFSFCNLDKTRLIFQQNLTPSITDSQNSFALQYFQLVSITAYIIRQPFLLQPFLHGPTLFLR